MKTAWHTFPSIPTLGIRLWSSPQFPYSSFGASPCQWVDELDRDETHPQAKAFACHFPHAPTWSWDYDHRWELGSRETEKTPILDLLGTYNPDGRHITLYATAIRECTEDISKTVRGYASIDQLAHDLAIIVFAHELGHALHHDRAMGLYGEKSSEGKEALAQHFTATVLHGVGTEALPIFNALLEKQPRQYHEWKNVGPTTWDRCRELFANEKAPVDDGNRCKIAKLSDLF